MNESGIIFEGTGKILSISLLRLAKQVITRASRRYRVALRRNKQAESGDLLEVYILVSASLEAFINEICQHKIDEARWTGKQPYWFKGLQDILSQKVDVRLKWRLVPQLLWQKAFDESRTPWQDFNVLIPLRNSLLHYRIEYLPSGRMPKYLQHIRHIIGPAQQDSGKPRTLTEIMSESETWIDMVCNLRMAKWAFNTGVAMIRQMLRLADQESRDDYIWLLEGSGIKRFPRVKDK